MTNDETTPAPPEDFDAEAVHDELINPLVLQIIAICEREGIPCLMSFYYRHMEDQERINDYLCTTHVIVPGRHSEILDHAAGAILDNGADVAVPT